MTDPILVQDSAIKMEIKSVCTQMHSIQQWHVQPWKLQQRLIIYEQRIAQQRAVGKYLGIYYAIVITNRQWGLNLISFANNDCKFSHRTRAMIIWAPIRNFPVYELELITYRISIASNPSHMPSFNCMLLPMRTRWFEVGANGTVFKFP